MSLYYVRFTNRVTDLEDTIIDNNSQGFPSSYSLNF